MKRDLEKEKIVKKQSPIYSKLLAMSCMKICPLPFNPLRKLRHQSALSVESLVRANVELSTLHKLPLLILICSHCSSYFTEGKLITLPAMAKLDSYPALEF